MSNNEFYTHKRSDTIKWIIAFTLIAVLLAGMIGAWVVLWDDKPVHGWCFGMTNPWTKIPYRNRSSKPL